MKEINLTGHAVAKGRNEIVHSMGKQVRVDASPHFIVAIGGSVSDKYPGHTELVELTGNSVVFISDQAYTVDIRIW
jgi:hypothetical protein